jgi:DNA polymerase delta subunit 3
LDDASEEEQEELFPESGDKSVPANRESKKDREDKLKQMMEDEDADGMFPSFSEASHKLLIEV